MPRDVPRSSLEEITSALPGIVWEADGTDLRMTFVSEQARTLLGHDPAAWVEEPDFWEDHLHPDDRVTASREAEAAIAALASVTLRYRFRDAEGMYHTVRDYVRVVEHADGHRHIVGFMVEVDAETVIETERTLLATAVEGAAESVVVTDAAGSILYVNPAFERVTGYSRAEVMGHNPRILKSGLHPPAFYRAMWATVAGGGRWTGELVNRRKDGSLYREEASITAVEFPGGQGRRYVAVKRDVTVEREDRAARDWLAAAVDSAMDAIFTVTVDGTYVAWNDAAERLYGWRRDEVVGRSIFDVAIPSEHEAICELVNRVAAGEAIGPVEMTHRGKGGKLLHVSVVTTPVRDQRGEVTGVATVARDISASLVEAAQRAQLEGQLRQAQKLEAIGTLAGAIAHDFNNLMTAIGGYAELALPQLSGTVRDDIEQVRNAADRATDLTRRLLAFSRPGPTEPRLVDLDEALVQGSWLAARLVPERIRFDLSAQSGVQLLADPVDIEQILLNLVVNAVHAIEADGEIGVTCRRDGAGAVITVRDTGAGIEPAALDRIFEPFFTTKPDGKGTGLGLATVSAIVRRLGGTITVDSAPGAGAAFTLHLPGAGGTALPGVAASGGELLPARAGGRLAVVEDSPSLRHLAARILEGAGYEVVEAASPAELLEVDLDQFDALVCDVVTPDISGPELLRRVGNAPPTLFVSGYTNEEIHDIPAACRWAFLPKPYSRGALLEAVARLLEPEA